MKSWATPALPTLPGEPVPLRLFDTAAAERFPAATGPGQPVRLYVCGITPYDATHLGHAATYVTFDLVVRCLRDAGHQVQYVQNITDVDDPLLQRAARDGLDWRELAGREIQLFRDDMTALRVFPPDHYVGVVESMAGIEASVAALLASGAAYRVPVPDSEAGASPAATGPGLVGVDDASTGPRGADLYLDLSRQPSFGAVSGWSRERMAEVFAERGGDPDRAGKRDPFDPLLWRAARPGEPSWPSATLGPGRPGWHIECTSIAVDLLGTPFDIQGGGTDLVFPHHEMSAVQAGALNGRDAFARGYVHQAMVGLDGEKMSKSKGNLVLVSRLRAEGVDPMAIRLVLLAHHYRTPWDYTTQALADAVTRLDRWRRACSLPPSTAESADAVATLRQEIRHRLADDLDSCGALAAVDRWAQARLESPAGGEQPPDWHLGPGYPVDPVGDAVDALLGIRL